MKANIAATWQFLNSTPLENEKAFKAAGLSDSEPRQNMYLIHKMVCIPCSRFYGCSGGFQNVLNEEGGRGIQHPDHLRVCKNIQSNVTLGGLCQSVPQALAGQVW